jgi:uncharacterized protein
MSPPTKSVDLSGVYNRIVDAMRARNRVLVAFSGGVDSGLVARIAHDALADDAIAVIADAESFSRHELAEALEEADEIGIPVRVIRVSELANDSYAANPTNRCYFCRKELGKTLRPLAVELGCTTIADGVNASDLGEFRPGIQAMNEAGFWHPLVDFGLAKADVRELSRQLGLSFHAKPSNACLSSRIAYGEAITIEKLRRVEHAEQGVRDLGFPIVRVRSHEGLARIEVPKEDLPRISAREIAEKVEQVVRSAGFAQVIVDPRGYRSGSMNETL